MEAKDATKAASEKESLRELYMALTRAEDYMEIFGKGRSGSGGNGCLSAEADSSRSRLGSGLKELRTQIS